jgi:phage FluMu protein Com
MPITFHCSQCDKLLRVADRMAGNKGKCPQCGTILLVPSFSQEDSAAPPEPPRQKTRPSQATIKEDALPSRRRAAADYNDEDEVPEEADRRPRKSRKKKSRQKSPLLLIGLIGCGFAFLLLCSGVGGLAWWYFSSSAGDDLVFMPNNCQLLVSIRNDQMMQSAAAQEIKRAIPDVEKNMKADLGKELGISSDDIESVFLGIGSTPKDIVMVVHTKRAFEVKEIISKIPNGNYTESKVGKYRVHDAQNTELPSICMLDQKRAVVGLKQGVHAVLQRDKKPDFSKNMEAAMKCVDFSKSMALAVDVQSLRSQPNLPRNMDVFGGQNNFLNSLTKINAAALQVQVTADIRYDFALLCQDAASANEFKTLVDGFLVQGRNSPLAPKEVKDMLELNLKVDGSKLTGHNTIKVAPLLDAYKKMNPMK